MTLLISQRYPLHSLCSQCRRKIQSTLPTKRLLTTSPPSFADATPPAKPSLYSKIKSQTSGLRSTSKLFEPIHVLPKGKVPGSNPLDAVAGYRPMPRPHNLHVYATRHNTHITLSNGNRQPLISVSAGNIGFRKAARGSYDAGFQLGAYVMGMIQQKGLLREIHGLEVVLRDFGPGREAIQKILLGSEGKAIRGRVLRVMDATRLKFGGTRGKKPRRLG